MTVNPRISDIAGKKFGRWTVLAKQGNNSRGGAIWLCRCACGTERGVLGSDLRKGKSSSCGCEGSRTTIGMRMKKHGMTGTRLYRTWKGMHARCNHPRWVNHFGKGITVCDEWATFEPFQKWAMSHGYADNLTIERRDNAKGYGPENCEWATMKTQARNRSIVHRAPDGRAWAEIAEENGIPVRVLNNRMSAGGWPPEVAATWPLGKKRAKRERTEAGQWASGPSTWRR